MKLQMLACVLLLSGCGGQTNGMVNKTASATDNMMDGVANSADGAEVANYGAITDVALTPEDRSKESTRIKRNDEEMARYARWRQSVLPTPRNAFPKIGACYRSRIKEIEIEHEYKRKWNWEENPKRDHGSISIPYNGHIIYSNGLEQSFDYETWEEPEPPPFAKSRVGDRVVMCVVAIPEHCPPGDFRGITYRTHDLRTGRVWEETDSPRDCGD